MMDKVDLVVSSAAFSAPSAAIIAREYRSMIEQNILIIR
jgi:hypothetical protein